MKKIIPYILGIIGIFFIFFGIQKSFALDIVSSPTNEQSGLYTGTGLINYIETNLNAYNCAGSAYLVRNGWSNLLGFPTNDDYYEKATSCKPGHPTILKILKKIDGDNYILSTNLVNGGSLNVNVVFLYHQSTNSIKGFYYGNSPFLTSSNVISVLNSSGNIDFYNWNFSSFTGTVIQTLSKPSVSFGVKSGVLPVYLSGLSGTHFFAYQGTDGRSYKVLDTFASGQDLPITSAGTGSVLPLGPFYTNDIILSRQVLGSGALYVQNSATALPNWELSNNNLLKTFNVFQNPIAYFTNSSDTVVKWDMNCQTPGYDSCILNSGVFKCSNSSGSLSPGGETCGGTVSPPVPSPVLTKCFTGITNTGSYSYYPISFTGTFQGTNNVLVLVGPNDSFFHPDIPFKMSIGGTTDVTSNFIGLNPLFTTTGSIIANTTFGLSSWFPSTITINTFSGGNVYSNDGTGTVGDFGVLKNLGFDYIYLSGASSSTFSIEYDSILQDFDGKEYVSHVVDNSEYSVGQKIRLNAPTRSIVLHLQKGGVYNLSAIQLGYFLKSYDYIQSCVEYTQDDVDAYGSGISNPLAISDALNDISQKANVSKNKYVFQNPLLQAFFDLVDGFLKDIGLSDISSLLSILIPERPDTTVTIPMFYFSGTQVGVQDIFITTDLSGSGIMNEPSYNPIIYNTNDTTYLPFIMAMICVAIYFIFYAVFISLLYFIPSIIVSFIEGILDFILPGLSDSSNSSGNIFSLFMSVAWWLYVGKIFLSVLVIWRFFLPFILTAKTYLLFFFSVALSYTGGWGDFQFYVNTIVLLILVGLTIIIPMYLLHRNGHLN